MERVKRFERSTPTLARQKLSRLRSKLQFIVVFQSARENALLASSNLEPRETRVNACKLVRTIEMATAR